MAILTRADELAGLATNHHIAHHYVHRDAHLILPRADNRMFQTDGVKTEDVVTIVTSMDILRVNAANRDNFGMNDEISHRHILVANHHPHRHARNMFRYKTDHQHLIPLGPTRPNA